MLAHNLGDVVDHLADAQIAHGGVFVVEQHFQYVGAQQIFIGQFALCPVAQYILHGELVAAGEGIDQVDDFAAAGAGKVADQAEIDQGDLAVCINKNIARMRIGMEKALFQNHGKQCFGDAVRQYAAGFLRQAVEREVAQQGVADVFLHQNLAVGIIAVYGGNMNIAVAVEGLAEALHIA